MSGPHTDEAASLGPDDRHDGVAIVTRDLNGRVTLELVDSAGSKPIAVDELAPTDDYARAIAARALRLHGLARRGRWEPHGDGWLVPVAAGS